MFDYVSEIKKWKLSKKYVLLCARYFYRKKIMKYFFTDLNSDVLDKDCLSMIDEVCPDWFERLCFEDNFIVNRSLSDKDKVSADSFTFDPLQRIKVYYAKTMELPFYDRYNSGRIEAPALTRDYLFTNKEKLESFRSKCEDIPYNLLIEHIRDIGDEEFIGLMEITQPLIIDFMMNYFFKIDFDELCELIRSGGLSDEIFKPYKRGEEWSYDRAYNFRNRDTSISRHLKPEEIFKIEKSK